MKKLLYVPVMHDVMRTEYDESEISAGGKKFNRLLKRYYELEIVPRILAYHKKEPFHKVYCEGLSANGLYELSFGQPTTALELPVYALIREGVKPVVTEDSNIRHLSLMLSAVCPEEKKLIPRGLYLEALEILIEEKLIREDASKRELEELIRNKPEIIDLMELRDELIAKKINETLREEENAVLFMGASHNVDVALAEMEIDIKIKLYVPFSNYKFI